MEKALLAELCNNLNRLGGMIPAVPCPELTELLEELFTEEEAEIAAKLPPAATAAPALAAKLARPEAEIISLLESMADKGTVLTRKKDGIVLYRLLAIMPGMFEFQFMRGTDTARDRRLARLYKSYRAIAESLVTQTLTAVKKITPPARIIPVEKTIQAGQTVYTFDQLSRYIESAEAIAVGHCFCRHQSYLLGETGCEAPKESCMNFGPGAQYTAERGITRMIGKEEAYQILKACEDHGLVHLSSNTSEFLEYLCNCCGCHCDILQKAKQTAKPIWIATSGYLAKVDEELCESCGTCVELCQMEAVALNADEKATVDENRCIGCGACANGCPTEAISMLRHPDVPTPPATARDLRRAMLSDIQRAQSGPE
ncbi:MAG: 4Fe-4S binding protein [Desulfobacterales bacterium]|nr:MAG: 4Fe-4S binding protein [Desulfobacterales bacterium]